MQNKKILAIFDFCDTLIGMQTANRFVTLGYKKNKRFDTIFNEFGRVILIKLKLLFGHRHKKWQLRQLNGLTIENMKNIVKDYVENELIPKENKKVLKKLLWHKSQGHIIVIVSGGFSEYIKYYAKKYNIEYVIATDLKIQNDKFTGKINGIDCMGINKIEKLKAVLNIAEFDLKNSYAYSDNISDIPLLSFVGNGIGIDFGQDIKWIALMNYQVLSVR